MILSEKACKKKNFFLTLFLFFLCVATSFIMRTHNYNREAESLAKLMQQKEDIPSLSFARKFFPSYHTNFMPYTIECAMMFYYTQKIAAGEKISHKASELHGLEDIAPYRQMIMGLEWFLGWGWRIKKALCGTREATEKQLSFQDNPDLANFVPVQLRLWMSLSSGFIFLLLLLLSCNKKQALFGGIFHAVAISAIARSTGQDIIRGNFAMPFITGTILLLYLLYRKEKIWHYLLLFISSFCAFAFWDLSLGLFSAFTLFEIAKYIVTGEMRSCRVKAWFVLFLAALSNALFVPFNQTYLMIMSPLLTVLMPGFLLMSVIFPKYKFSTGKRVIYSLLLLLFFYAFWHCAIKNEEYLSAYSHFSELTRAKIQFNNVKPKDPSLLSYDARMLWTPAMHSANWKILRTFFPSFAVFANGVSFKGGMKVFSEFLAFPLAAGLYFFLLLLLPLFEKGACLMKRQSSKMLFFHSFTLIFFIAFLYVVRYHEFVIIFLAISLTVLLRDLSLLLQWKQTEEKRKKIRRQGKLFFLALLRKLPPFFAITILLLETSVSLLGNRVYSSDVHLQQTAALIQWFRKENMQQKCVITDFTVGPMLLCYARCHIAMQPQFGLARIRKPTEEYLKLLYHGKEKDLAKFCNDLKADYFIHNAGYLGPAHIYSERYIANAVKLKKDSPVVLMRYMPQYLRYFYKIDPPRKKGYPNPALISSVYTVFKIIRPEERIRSMRLAFLGERLLQEGKREAARRCAKEAFALDPLSFRAKNLCLKVFDKIPRMTLKGVEF